MLPAEEQQVGDLVEDASKCPLFMFIKEDENLYPNLDYSPVKERTKRAIEGLRRSQDARGGLGLIFAPHITEISVTHGKLIEEIGYHVRDYFVKQMDRFRHVPRGVVAHSTHVKGVGTFENGVEKPRITVTLATGIPESVCREVNLGYCDPHSIRPEEWQGREHEGVLYVPHAGEILYRLKDDPFASGTSR